MSELDLVEFEEFELPNEPGGDVKLRLACGMCLRERVILTDARAEGVETGAANPASNSFTFKLSHALLGEGDAVEMVDGQPIISRAHEIVLSAEAFGRLGEEGVAAMLAETRQKAAAKARRQFAGYGAMGQLMSRAYLPPTLPAPITSPAIPIPITVIEEQPE